VEALDILYILEIKRMSMIITQEIINDGKIYNIMI